MKARQSRILKRPGCQASNVFTPVLSFSLALLLAAGGMTTAAEKESLPPLENGTAPQDFDELRKGCDPCTEPLDVERLKEGEADGVVLRVLRYTTKRFNLSSRMCRATPEQLDAAGVRATLKPSQVIRDKRYKVWVSAEKKIIRLHDLQKDPSEEKNLLQSDLAEEKEALQKFQAVVDAFPEKDARPLYEPRAPNAWDKNLKKTTGTP